MIMLELVNHVPTDVKDVAPLMNVGVVQVLTESMLQLVIVNPDIMKMVSLKLVQNVPVNVTPVQTVDQIV